MTAFSNFPVSNQSDNLTITAFSVTSATNLFSVDTTGFQVLVVQITGAGSGCTWTSECSDDNTNWLATPMQAGLAGTSTTTGTATGILLIPVVAKYHRLRVSTYGSGTITGLGHLRSTISSSPTFAYLKLATNQNGAPSAARVTSAATTNSTLVRGSFANLVGFVLSNTTGAAKYFKVYNKATAPTVGTDTPVLTVMLPATSTTVWDSTVGVAMNATGLGYGITGAVADSDTTATAVNDVVGMIYYI